MTDDDRETPRETGGWDWSRPRLIIGTRDARGERDTTLALAEAPMTLALKRELARARRRRGDAARPGQDITDLLARVVDQWGATDMRRMSDPQRVRFVGQQPIADVLAALIAYRRREMGARYSVRWRCPAPDCRSGEVVVGFDVDELDVTGDPAAPPRWVELAHPLPRGERRVIAAQVGTPVWSAITTSDAGDQAGLIVRIMQSAVVAVRDDAGAEGPIATGEWDRMHMLDAAAIEEAMEQIASVDLRHSIRCATCGVETQLAVQTDVDFFLGSPSVRRGTTKGSTDSSSGAALSGD